jgi:protein-S-isoprenylcysteine O-methyltransferase Ste14
MSFGDQSTALLALALYAIYLGLVVGVRVLIQVRRTGSTGLHAPSGQIGSAEWIAGVGFVVALLVGVAAPVLALLDLVEPLPALDTRAVHIMGFGFAITGIAMTFYSQLAMGASWRAGVDPEERTELVTGGPFALVRNPIFAASLPASLGFMMLVPSWIALLGFCGLVVALELQVRAVEEPYLLRAHAEEYAAYAARVGRFVPGVGRIKRPVVM